MRVVDNCDFYPTYAGFDYFAGVHRHASDFLTPPPPPGVAVSAGPHHVGPPPQPQQQQPLADHVTPREYSHGTKTMCCKTIRALFDLISPCAK